MKNQSQVAVDLGYWKIKPGKIFLLYARKVQDDEITVYTTVCNRFLYCLNRVSCTCLRLRNFTSSNAKVPNCYFINAGMTLSTAEKVSADEGGIDSLPSQDQQPAPVRYFNLHLFRRRLQNLTIPSS